MSTFYFISSGQCDLSEVYQQEFTEPYTLVFGTPKDYKCIQPEEYLEWIKIYGPSVPYEQKALNKQQMSDLLHIASEQDTQVYKDITSELEKYTSPESILDTVPEQDVKNFLVSLFDLGMYMRRWNGDRNNYPLNKQTTDVPICQVVPKEIQDKIRQYLPELETGLQEYTMFETYIRQHLQSVDTYLSLYPQLNYLPLTSGQLLGQYMDRIKKAIICIRVASSVLIESAYGYMKPYGYETLVKFDDYLLNKLDTIGVVPTGEREIYEQEVEEESFEDSIPEGYINFVSLIREMFTLDKGPELLLDEYDMLRKHINIPLVIYKFAYTNQHMPITHYSQDEYRKYLQQAIVLAFHNRDLWTLEQLLMYQISENEDYEEIQEMFDYIIANIHNKAGQYATTGSSIRDMNRFFNELTLYVSTDHAPINWTSEKEYFERTQLVLSQSELTIGNTTTLFPKYSYHESTRIGKFLKTLGESIKQYGIYTPSQMLLKRMLAPDRLGNSILENSIKDLTFQETYDMYRAINSPNSKLFRSGTTLLNYVHIDTEDFNYILYGYLQQFPNLTTIRHLFSYYWINTVYNKLIFETHYMQVNQRIEPELMERVEALLPPLTPYQQKVLTMIYQKHIDRVPTVYSNYKISYKQLLLYPEELFSQMDEELRKTMVASSFESIDMFYIWTQQVINYRYMNVFDKYVDVPMLTQDPLKIYFMYIYGQYTSPSIKNILSKFIQLESQYMLWQ